jgi:uncharacterized protein (DUF2267 family)
MTFEAMLGRVAIAAGLEKSEAERATRAFLETLSLRLGKDEARELASQLPVELQDTLPPTRPDVEKISPDEFLSRLSDQAGLEPARAEQVAHAVWSTLQDSVSGDELEDVKSQLPDEFIELFEASGALGKSGNMA